MSNRQRTRGRNARCDCGSGLKAKRCCLRTGNEASAARSRLQGSLQLEVDVGNALLRRAERWHGAERIQSLLEVPGSKLPEEELEPLVVTWLTFMARFEDGETLPERYLRRGLARGEREHIMLQAQQLAWISIWEIATILPGGDGLELRDVLTGEKRTVPVPFEGPRLAPRAGILARVLDLAEGSRLSGLHPRSLPPRETEMVTAVVRKEFGFRARAQAEALREGETARRLITLWTLGCQAVAGEGEGTESAPRNGSRDPEFFRASYLFLPRDRSELRRRLLDLADADLVESDDSGDLIHLGQLDPGPLRWRLIAVLRLREDSLLVETRSQNQQEALAEFLERRMRGHLRRQGVRREYFEEAQPRWAAEVARGLPGLRDEASRADPVAQDQQLLTMRDAALAVWPDRPLRELGGLSPRQAVGKDARRRRQVETLLAELEHDQWTLPPVHRFDLAELRRQLALED